MPQKPAPKKRGSFGSCEIARFHPDVEALSPARKILNVNLTFQEALKINLALDECVRKANRYNMSHRSARRCGVGLEIKLHGGSNLRRHHIRLPVLTREQRVGFGIARESFLGWVDCEGAGGGVGDVRQVRSHALRWPRSISAFN
jgi:hypothetical protein